MLGGGDDFTFYLYEHKKEDAESEFDFVDIAFYESEEFVGNKRDTDITKWTDEMFDERMKKKLNWKRMISIPDDLVSYRNNNYIFDSIVSDENEDFKRINRYVDYFKPTVLLKESMPSFIHCIEKLREIVRAMPSDPFVLEQGKDVDFYSKEDLYYQFDKLDYFLEMMEAGNHSIIAFGI